MSTPSRPEQFVYYFGAKELTQGNAKMKELLGGKGANLAEMALLDLPVPPGFTISTEICTQFYLNDQKLPAWVEPQIQLALKQLEKALNKGFGSKENPLLLSVRSGARASMPGMMDTILNLGLNDETVLALAKVSQNPRFAWDSYRRFIQMYSDVVLEVNSSLFEVYLEDLKDEKKVKLDTELSAEDLKSLVLRFKNIVKDQTGSEFPIDPMTQLMGAISAVFRSWNTPRAVTYRKLHGIPSDWGTAVNVQAMVFGNLGDDSATGVAFTRDPSTGEKKFYGEFLVNAQGEDVVAGIRTPQPVTKIDAAQMGVPSLEELMPQAYLDLEKIYKKLETYFKDMQDIEFTIERGKLWMLQTRTGKRTARAAIKIALDMLDEGLITTDEALLRVEAKSLDQLLHPTLDPKATKTLLAKGLPASPGGVFGQIVFTSEEAVSYREKGLKVILVRVETSPEDIAGMWAAQGILTTRGGMTSHAAVVARGMGKCCVAGCGDVEVNYADETLKVKGYVLKKGDVLTLDGSTGEVFLGEIKTIEPKLDEVFARLMQIADSKRVLKVRANADTPKDAAVARQFGAEGIGLCRTEHMFFGADRIDVVRQMILAETREERLEALKKLLPMQRADFAELFKIMNGFPVTIRLLDPPLHEFVPHSDAEALEFATRVGLDVNKVKQKVKALYEFNPMLGHRGSRLAVTFPEIYQMQVRAIAEAACLLIKEQNLKLEPEIMLPLILANKELELLRQDVVQVVDAVMREQGVQFNYQVGTMIELPRAAITADQIATKADFFSFGTNDLTQTTLGLSRDDAGRFLPSYLNEGIFKEDPFVSIDQEGVGYLVKLGVEKGRSVKADLKTGVCGEHGGDPESIAFFHKVGLNYISCSPYRVPIARLAAAQVAIRKK